MAVRRTPGYDKNNAGNLTRKGESEMIYEFNGTHKVKEDKEGVAEYDDIRIRVELCPESLRDDSSLILNVGKEEVWIPMSELDVILRELDFQTER
jgi:hypothetical protein